MRIAATAFLLCSAAFAAQPDYFPLQTGNQWTYRSTRFGQTFTVEVTGTQTAANQAYYVVQGFPTGTVWLRMADDGTLYAYDPNARNESVWAAFGAKEGDSYATGIDPCNQTARIRTRSAKADVPVGHVDNALTIDYPPSGCADAGLTSEMYLPYIGLLQRSQTSFAGPVVFDLTYARLNDGLTILTAPELNFTYALDNLVYTPDSTATARLTLRNTQSQPLTLTFPTGQRYDVVIRNEKGEEVYQWSRGKAFTMIFGTMPLTGEKTWTVSFPVPSQPGKYTVEAWLATQPPDYRARMAMTVK